jgi:hypothetical protein
MNMGKTTLAFNRGQADAFAMKDGIEAVGVREFMGRLAGHRGEL